MLRAQCEECGTKLYQAGERAPEGDYLRVDDGSFQRLQLPSGGLLPASFDGHVALYRAAAAPCACERRRQGAVVAHAAGQQRSTARDTDPVALRAGMRIDTASGGL